MLMSGMWEYPLSDLEVSKKIVILLYVCPMSVHFETLATSPSLLLFSLPMAIPFFQVQYHTLQPAGLNAKLCFYSKEHWYAFIEWYTQHQKSNEHTPITQPQLTLYMTGEVHCV